mgnify:CR=1 FL=1
MFNIFTTQSILKQTIASESEKPKKEQSLFFRVLKARKKVFVSTEHSDQQWQEELHDKYGIIVNVQKSAYISSLQTYPEKMLENPSSLFVLELSPAECLAIEKNYGVLCRSGANINLSLLIDMNDEHTTTEHEPLAKGWATVFNDVVKLPSNSLLICDRYLFSFRYAKAGNGFINVKEILTELLPSELNTDYHVTIVFDPTAINRSYTFKNIVTELYKLKNFLRKEYPIYLEVLGLCPDHPIYTRLHNRRIVSNYFIVKAEHKIAAFDKNIGTVSQSITPQALFTLDSLNRQSSPPLKSIEQIVATLKEFSKFLASNYIHSTYIYALEGEIKERCLGFKNRMLK